MGSLCITMKIAVFAVVLASAMAVQMEESARMEVEEAEAMQVMSKLGLRSVQEHVDKELWQARQAQASADDEDAEIARLLAELEGLDAEKDAAEKDAKQREVEAKQATAAKLKETAKQKFESAMLPSTLRQRESRKSPFLLRPMLRRTLRRPRNFAIKLQRLWPRPRPLPKNMRTL